MLDEHLLNVVANFSKVPVEQYIKDRTNGQSMSTEEQEEFHEEFKNIVMPRRATLFSAGYDLSVPFDVTIGPTPVLIPTGIRALIDNGYFLMLCPRSGLGMKYGMQLLNTMGIIDSDYAYAENYGHIMAKVCADKEFTLKAGERFMQGIFIPFGISRNGNTLNRRTGGMGSTGSK